MKSPEQVGREKMTQSHPLGHVADFEKICEAFQQGANIARCDIPNDTDDVRIIFGYHSMGDGPLALTLSNGAARTVFSYMHDALGWSKALVFRPESERHHALIAVGNMQLKLGSVPKAGGGFVVVLCNLVGAEHLFDAELAVADPNVTLTLRDGTGLGQAVFSQSEARALARFLNHIACAEFPQNTVEDSDASEIRSAIEKIRDAMANAGFAPR
jgi:hypothetical protein